MDLSVKYLGLNLKNPVIIGSSGLSGNVEGVEKLAENGAGAVVLKSLFEEQIIAESQKNIDSNYSNHSAAFDYISDYTRENTLENYLNFVKEAKQKVDIPVIASINCISSNDWMHFSKRVEKAGADALELNVSFLPADDKKSSAEYEKIYFDIVEEVRKQVAIPISLKMSFYSSGLAHLIKKLSWTGNVDGFVLFNRFYRPDIDIEEFKITSSGVFSIPEDIALPLRWIALLSNKIQKDLVPTTGIHDAAGVIKQILVGAQAVQVVSAIYRNGPQHIKYILDGVEDWMKRHNFSSLADFRGKMCEEEKREASVFERVQFMKYYGGIS